MSQSLHPGRWLSLVAVIASLFAVGLVVATKGGADEAEDIAALSVLDSFERNESPLVGPGGKWAALQWTSSSGGTKAGAVTLAGWRAVDSYSVVNGAYWKEKFSDKGDGDAVSVTMQEAPNSKDRYVALWLNMPEPEVTKSGYQLSWTWTSEPEAPGSYDIVLSKWISGSKTVLASKAAASVPNGTTMALSYKEGVVSAWSGTLPSLGKVISANDGWFASGYAGIEASGNSSRSQGFSAGSLEGEKTEPCAPGTDFYGGRCWETTYHSSAQTPVQASSECGAEGGELPNLLALANFALRPGITLHSEGEWSAELTSFSGKNAYAIATVFDSGEVDSAVYTATRRFRCVFPSGP